MSAQQETLDEIIAQLEAAPDFVRFGGPALAERLKKAVQAERELNSIRAIHAVEMATREANAVKLTDEKWERDFGNAAKVRKALTALVEYWNWGGYDAGRILRLQEEARAALSAPAQNCDLFGGDYKMLHTAWHDWAGSPSGMNANGTAKLTFGKWLLAPANKKGGET